LSNPTDSSNIELTPTEEVRTSAQSLLPVIAKIEDCLMGEDQVLAFFSLIAIAVVNQYPGMTDEQISKGIDRIALNITQMCQEFEFENKLKERIKDADFVKSAN
jgi:hypothetical protein